MGLVEEFGLMDKGDMGQKGVMDNGGEWGQLTLDHKPRYLDLR